MADPILIFEASQGEITPLLALSKPVPEDPIPDRDACPAHIDIDPIDERVIASHNPENGVPEHVFRNVVLRVPAPADVRGDELEEYVDSERFQQLFGRVAAGYERERNSDIGPDDFGNREEGRLDEDAEEALEEIERDLQDLPRAPIMLAEQSAPETGRTKGSIEIDDRWEIRADTSDQELRRIAREIRGDAEESGVQIGDDVVEYLETVRDEISDDDDEDDEDDDEDEDEED